MNDWPVLRTYDEAHQLRIAMPIGGIGTGTVSLGGRGDLRDWELRNRPRKGYAPKRSFFAIRTARPDGEAVTRALEGPIDPVLYEGAHGSAVPNHGLPRFRHATFHAAYPLAQVQLDDESVPVNVRLQAFNPLIPADAEASGIPIAVLRYVVTNPTQETLDVSVAGSLQAVPGDRFEVTIEGICTGLHSRAGRLALAALDEADISTRTSWSDPHWSGDILDFWDDFSADGRLEERTSDSDAPIGSVAVKRSLAPGETHAFTFVLGWRFPDRMDWSGTTVVGNYYSETYASAWQAIVDTVPKLEQLERKTVAWVRAFCESDLPDALKEAALFNLSTLRNQTCFRTPDGKFWGWEGCNDDSGSCHGNCTHVWNYEQATAFLFGDLARSMRDTEFRYGTGDDGHMVFRVQLPLDRAREDGVAAADGQMGCLVKLYRDWRLSGDDEFLRSLWPKAKLALEFAWVPGGWDADKDGVMEGSQHNTMDVEYFGPNPEIGVWYLAALRAAEEMARYLGDTEFADTCGDLFRRGSAWLDANLFNGDYYRHEIRPPGKEEAIAPGLRLTGVGARDLVEPEFQIGDGCLADQLVGQVHAHVTGLGHLLDEGNVRTTLQSIVRYNHVSEVWGHFNPVRSYALGDESGLTVASYPHGNRPARPFPYYAEFWTGLEYTAAAGLLYEGLVSEGVQVIEDVRRRYDGRKRNPFDEAECGHHYARAMASWAALLAMTRFSYDGVDKILRVKAATGDAQWFWSNGDAYGTVAQRPEDDGTAVELKVLGGSLAVRTIELTGLGATDVGDRVLGEGEALTTLISR
ncbi:MAG TPA: GH116 family glycosyl-hydrolase [Actinopolymorphaceae bacterium]